MEKSPFSKGEFNYSPFQQDLEKIQKSILQGKSLQSADWLDRAPAEMVINAYKFAIETYFDREGSDKSKDGVLTTRSDLVEMASFGTLHGTRFDNRSISARKNFLDPYERRRSLMYFYVYNKGLAETIVRENISGFHGTRSGPLPSILEHGLLPLSTLRSLGLLIPSGERAYAGLGLREATSFGELTDVLNLRRYYGEGRPYVIKDFVKSVRRADRVIDNYFNKGEGRGYLGDRHIYRMLRFARDTKELISYLQSKSEDAGVAFQKSMILANFPVLCGVNLEGVSSSRIFTPDSDIGNEFIVKGGLGINNIRMFCIPGERIPILTEMLGDKNLEIPVYPIEDIAPQVDFYHIKRK